MRTIIKIASTLLLFLTTIINGFSQDVKVKATIDSNAIRIGEQTKLHLSIEYRGDKGPIKIQWPTFKDTIIEKIEIVEVSKTDTTIPDKNDPLKFIQSQHITITSFDSGFYAIPPFTFTINGDTTHKYETEALLFQVNNVATDTTQAIKDIKQPMDEPFHWKEALPYVYWGLGIAAVVAIIAFIIHKLAKRKPIVPEKPKVKIPPHVIALQELEKIKAEKLWLQEKEKMYYSQVSDALRLYIEERFNIQALEQTSDEIMANMRNVVIDQESKNKLKQILLLADLVKFAKEQPLVTESEMSLANAFDFVNGTKREEQIEPTVTTQA